MLGTPLWTVLHIMRKSCHICPNSFRFGISQLTSTLKVWVKVSLMHIITYHKKWDCVLLGSYPVSMISLFLPHLPQWKQHGNIYNPIPAPNLPWPLSNCWISSFWNLHASTMCVTKAVSKRVVNICIIFTFDTIHVIYCD